MRWATVIESVLKMMNAPTKIEIAPKATRIPRMIFTNEVRPSSVKRSCFFALWTLACGPSCWRSEAWSLSAETPSRAPTRIEL